MSRQTLLLEILQWGGAVGIIIAHVLNAIGPEVYPFNIIAFFIGTMFFLMWASIISSKPQITVNLVSVIIGIAGLINAFTNI